MRAVLGHRVGDFVPFEDMVERTEPDIKVLECPERGEDLVLSVRMAVNDALSEDDLGQSFKFEVDAWRRAALGNQPQRRAPWCRISRLWEAPECRACQSIR